MISLADFSVSWRGFRALAPAGPLGGRLFHGRVIVADQKKTPTEGRAYRGGERSWESGPWFDPQQWGLRTLTTELK